MPNPTPNRRILNLKTATPARFNRARYESSLSADAVNSAFHPKPIAKRFKWKHEPDAIRDGRMVFAECRQYLWADLDRLVAR